MCAALTSAPQSALFEQLGTLGGLPLPVSVLGGASSQPAATWQQAAANLKLYLECVRCLRERLSPSWLTLLVCQVFWRDA